jgi:DNA helicase-2/ATP-dependent DNA helicase PcrA
VGGKGAAKLWEKFSSELAKGQGAARDDASGAKRASPRLAIALTGCSAEVPKKAAVAWAQFSATVAQLEVEPICRQPARMIKLILDAGYEDYLEDTFANYRNRLEDLEQLASFALQFSGTTDFLTQLSLLSNLEAEDDQVAATDDERVRLSTIHQAKGLEFDVVFVIMLCDGLFPSARSLESPEGEEEERRLFYVAITRARQELYLSYPLIPFTQGYQRWR